MKAMLSGIRHIIPIKSRQRKLEMPIFETERLVLRKLHQGDLKDIVAWEDVSRARNTEVDAREFLDYCFREYRGRGIGPWGMQLKQSGVIVGNCGFPGIIFKDQCGEINCYVTLRHRGCGLASEALKALLAYGFRDIGLIRIQARCEPDNLSSVRLTQKLGMKFEGFVQHAHSSKDKSPKQKLYAILDKDFNMASPAHRTLRRT
jgi:ribosomal-protein-alanine N-acetyltransferase